MEGNVPPPDPRGRGIAEGIGAGAVGGGVEKDLHPREAHLQDLQIPPQQREQGHLDGDLFGRSEVVIAVTFRVGDFYVTDDEARGERAVEADRPAQLNRPAEGRCSAGLKLAAEHGGVHGHQRRPHPGQNEEHAQQKPGTEL